MRVLGIGVVLRVGGGSVHVVLGVEEDSGHVEFSDTVRVRLFLVFLSSCIFVGKKL